MVVNHAERQANRLVGFGMVWRFIGCLFSSISLFCAIVFMVAGYALWHLLRDIPDYEQLARYEPPVMTRVHAADGSLLAEYAKEFRLYLPISSVPERLIQAFLSAEDKNFYKHNGIDYESVLSAMFINFRNWGTGRRLIGASTITQQVAKNFLLTNEISYERKFKEAFLALKIERTFSKDRVLELYLNEIYLGVGSYGIAAASLKYFGKSVSELDLQEMAYLAALPKAPNNYHPFRATLKATKRRNWVINRMRDNGFITSAEAQRAQNMPLKVNFRSVDPHTFEASYFAEEVRRKLYSMYGVSKLYEGGLSVRTTLDPKMQLMARKALINGLVAIDRKQGWRGPVAQISVDGDWTDELAQIRALTDVAPWRMGVVLTAGTDATIGLQSQPTRFAKKDKKEQDIIRLGYEGIAWINVGKKRTDPRVDSVLHVGDVVYVAPKGKSAAWELVQIPDIDGAIVVLNPQTGSINAMVGGFSYDKSEFNRVTQAFRQPGSAFKPFVYIAALENGYTPSSIVMDAPIEIEQGADLGIWRPRNYGRKFAGPSTLRRGIERSRNVMTVRLAQNIGMPLVSEYAKRFGIYDDLMPVLAMSLGAGETSVLRLTAAYAMLCNGGRKIIPTLIDRIQDRWGNTIYRHDQRVCKTCVAESWDGQYRSPVLIDNRQQIIDPHSAYQMTSMLEGVIQRGTGSVVRAVKKPLAGKTGTSNDERDAWFIGYSPDLAVGVFVGYDLPRSMGKGSTGGRVAAPIFRDFMKMALADKPAVPFRMPPGIQLFRVNVRTGLKAAVNDRKAIMEVFKPGTAPPGQHSMIGYTEVNKRKQSAVSASDRSVSSGTGGLY